MAYAVRQVGTDLFVNKNGEYASYEAYFYDTVEEARSDADEGDEVVEVRFRIVKNKEADGASHRAA